MTKNIVELHGLMSAGGLKQVKKMLDSKFGSSMEKDDSGKEIDRTSTDNVNMNTVTDGVKRLFRASGSEETIYRSAVPKRFSSSSDEGQVDTSNDSIDLLNGTFNPIPDGKPDQTSSTQRRELPCAKPIVTTSQGGGGQQNRIEDQMTPEQ